MPSFEFRGRKYQGGGIVTGVRSAPTKQALAAMLRSESILPVQITESAKQKTKKKAGRAGSKDIALLSKQFSVMLDAGLPLIQCLELLAEQQEKPLLKDTLLEVRESVESGSTLADAMKKHPNVFEPLFVNMIAAGEAGGVLDVILQRLSSFAEKAVKLKRSVVSASVYPAVVLAVAVVIVFIIMVWVIPVFASLFTGLNAPLPAPTRFVMAISDYAVTFSLPLIVLVAAGAVGLRYFYQTEEGKLYLDGLLLKTPLIGIVLKKIAIARFSLTLSTLLTSGIPLLDALDITANTAGNSVIAKALLQVRQEVSEGKTLVEPLKKSTLFPSMVIQVVSVGEQTGELDQMLEKLSVYYEDESDAAIANLMTMIEPILIIFLGVVIGGIVISMYLPIFTLIGNLSQQ
ncbi:MAG: type II secretion system F family protein [Acidobacteriota bacterium]|nr:MAG: type II secretion system F family protein [Acidobacteriota bacterium]